MGAADPAGCVFKASGRDAGSVEAYADAFWSHLRDRVSGLPAAPPDGCGVAEAPRCALQWSACVDLGFLAAALHDADGNSWEAFLVPHADGCLRTGWKRRWQPEPIPPYPWKAASDRLADLARLPSVIAPDFLLLAISLGPSPPSSASDLAARVAAAFDDGVPPAVVNDQLAQHSTRHT